MAQVTKIAWARSTLNPWIGCSKVGPGCDHCYAEALDKRHKWGGATHWGASVPRYRTSEHTWKQPLKWNKQAELEKGGALIPSNAEWSGPIGYWPVFCASLADVFDNEVPSSWRFDLWNLIEATPNLSWLLVTKRIGNVYNMVPWKWQSEFPVHVRLLITVCNQEEADRDIPKLIALPCKNGISYEPALGSVDWSPWLGDKSLKDLIATFPPGAFPLPMHLTPRRSLEWIIVGGESTQGAGKARPFDREWAYSTIRQCRAADVACFIKQLGSNVLARGCDVYAPHFRDRAGADPAEWPEDLRVQEFPT